MSPGQKRDKFPSISNNNTIISNKVLFTIKGLLNLIELETKHCCKNTMEPEEIKNNVKEIRNLLKI
jgi:hypothetical protein